MKNRLKQSVPYCDYTHMMRVWCLQQLHLTLFTALITAADSVYVCLCAYEGPVQCFLG